jgi:hypothetical protein
MKLPAPRGGELNPMRLKKREKSREKREKSVKKGGLYVV